MQQKIILLDSHTINQIAAGEVVERPSSVVKELIENALDAGATRVDVHLENSGKRLISVRDNGSGMSLEDAKSSLLRHATSKIQHFDDLYQTTSFGFRGEALPSIASVSHMKLSTAEEDGLRHVLNIDSGEILSVEKSSGPKGTEILVEDLFNNTPARLKFLKSDATELAATVDIVSRYIVAYPEVGFRLSHGLKELLLSSGNRDLLTALAGIWGRDIAAQLAKIECVLGGIKVTGFVSPPHLTRPTRAYQWMFVNRRPIRSKTLMAAFDRAYRSLTPEKRFPYVLLMLEMDPGLVDVNVSPTKSEVKFQHEPQIFEVVRHAIKSSLMEHGMIPGTNDITQITKELTPQTIENVKPTIPAPVNPNPFSFQKPLVKDSITVQAPLILEDRGLQTPSIQPPQNDQLQTKEPNLDQNLETRKYPFSDLLDELRIIGSYLKTFIIAENKKGLVLIDHHVAHERVLYEQLWEARHKNAVEQQALLSPEPLHLDRVSSELLGSYLEELKGIGFDLEPFGGGSYLLRAVPCALKNKAPALLLREIIEGLIHGEISTELVPAREQIWITCACKMAVKSGDALSLVEMEKLIQDLAKTKNPYLCPHGRPITVTFAQDDLLRKFKRA